MTTALSRPEPDLNRADIASKGRVVLLINSMEGGGAERAMANLLGHLLPHLKDRQVDLVLLDNHPRVQDLPNGLRVVTLDGRRGMLRSGIELARHLRAEPATVCISFLARANVLNIALSAWLGHRAIVSERVQTSAHLASARGAAVLRWITRLSYPRAEAVVAVSRGVADDLQQNFGVPESRLQVIGNPIDGQALAARAAEPLPPNLPKRFILAVGRLVVNKNFPMMIDAYAEAQPEADLVILGEGPDRAALQARIAALGLTDRIHLPGFMPNPYPPMAHAEYLVSCSNAEGFPNTLIEAMTLGRAIVATDCPSGPGEVLRGRAEVGVAPEATARDGVLLPCNDVPSLVAAMRFFEDPARRADYAARARVRARDFGIDDVVNRYLNLIEGAQ